MTLCLPPTRHTTSLHGRNRAAEKAGDPQPTLSQPKEDPTTYGPYPGMQLHTAAQSSAVTSKTGALHVEEPSQD
jgi:hypothetical protein